MLLFVFVVYGIGSFGSLVVALDGCSCLLIVILCRVLSVVC